MAYDIEVICIGEDRYDVLQDAALLLNGVQSEFRFRLPSAAPREQAVGFRREKYLTQDVWNFLRSQRATLKGNRPYIIAFISAPLESSSLGNIFGSHEGAEGLAVVTLHSSTQYVRETRRFCCYYMTRYALSFVNPLIKAHNDPERKKCYFHKKLYKPDIRASMDSGYICDQDQQQLDDPPPGIAKPLSQDERAALRCMRQLVSGDYPHAVIMKGGGVKGLAFAGALIEIEKYFWFDRHVGASAGAIAAVLLAAGYAPAELVDILSKKNFREFMDAPIWRVPFNLIFKSGCYPGNHFFSWIATLLGKKITKESEILMSDLNGAVIYASRRGPCTVKFDSLGERKDSVAAFATRCSMSIPIFFVPQQIDGRRVYDGGLRNNFPVTRFLKDHPGAPFIALYLSAAGENEKVWIGSDLIDIWIDGEDREVVDANTTSVVIIDTSPIGTVDFNLDQVEKEFLLKVGRASALTFLKSRNFDDGPADAVVQAAVEEAEACRRAVKQNRKRRKMLKLIGVASLLAFLVFAAWFERHTEWILPIWMNAKEMNINVPLERDLNDYRDEIIDAANRASTTDVHSRPTIISLEWKRPVLFEAKHFELIIKSANYDLNGLGVQELAGGLRTRLPLCQVDRNSIAVVLETNPKEAHVFIRREIPEANHYDSEHGDPDLSWSISRVGKSSCPLGDGS